MKDKKKKSNELMDLVRKGYDTYATHFAQTRRKALWPVLEEWVNEVRIGERVLDAACGSGRLCEAISARGAYYQGFDFSSGLLDEARKAFPRGVFSEADLCDRETWPRGSFDRIFCVASLQHLPSRDLRLETMRSFHDKLCSSGVLYLSNWNLWRRPKFRHKLWLSALTSIIPGKLAFGDIIFDWHDKHGCSTAPRYYHAFRQSELEQLVTEAGFRDIKLWQDEHNIYLKANK